MSECLVMPRIEPGPRRYAEECRASRCEICGYEAAKKPNVVRYVLDDVE
jgi:hypothetical protein